MNDDKKEIVKKENAIEGEIINHIGDAGFITQFKDKPLETLAEVGLGLIKIDKAEKAMSLGRILKAGRSGNLIKQTMSEFSKLQKMGKIETDEEIAEHPYATKALIDLMEVIDNNPEEKRLEAIKAMFILMIEKDQDQNKEILAYQLFETSKKLTASNLVILKTIYDLVPILKKEASQSTNTSPRMSTKAWYKRIANKLGHDITYLIQKDVEELADLMLVPKESTEATIIHPINFRLTDFGERLYESLLTYQNLIVEMNKDESK